MSDKRELTTSERIQTGCGCLLLLVLAGIAALGSLGETMCETTVFARSISPDGLTEASVQMTDCGAMTGFSRVVWVQPRWLPNDRWLSCRAVAFDGSEPIAIEWKGGRLRISSPAKQSSVIATANSCYGWNIDLRLRRQVDDVPLKARAEGSRPGTP